MSASVTALADSLAVSITAVCHSDDFHTTGTVGEGEHRPPVANSDRPLVGAAFEFSHISVARTCKRLDALSNPAGGLWIAPADGGEVCFGFGPPTHFHDYRPKRCSSSAVLIPPSERIDSRALSKSSRS